MRRPRVQLLSAAMMLGAVAVGWPAVPAHAQCETLETDGFIGLDSAGDDRFGQAVAIDGDYAIVGALEFIGQYGLTSRGSAYIFERDPGTGVWTQAIKLLPTDLEDEDEFGNSVSISGDYAVAGAHKEDEALPNAGAIYVFFRDGATWGEVRKLMAADAGFDDRFGTSVAIDGDTVVIGARYEDELGADAGAAYVFQRGGLPDEWTQVKKLTAFDGQALDEFGISVAISGDWIIVGAFREDEAADGAGAAYIFGRNEGGTNNWGHVTKLMASDGDLGDEFGNAVSISSDPVHGVVALVGAHQDDGDGSCDPAAGTSGNTGAAYLFRYDAPNWQEDKLLASDCQEGNRFGSSVQVEGDRAIVGAIEARNLLGVSTGAAYVYWNVDETWWEWAKLLDQSAGTDDNFGAAVALSSNDLLVGATSGEIVGGPFTTGEAFLFGFPPADPDCNENGIADNCETMFGLADDCNLNGVPDECDLAPGGGSEDCNENGIPDECDISSGFSEDCNFNGVPDECDLAPGGGSEDCNENSIPDECELDCHVDMVVLIDTSNSMNDDLDTELPDNFCEDVVAYITENLPTVAQDIRMTALTITPSDDGCPGIMDGYVDQFTGTSIVPGTPGLCDELTDNESWGPATAILAQHFPWIDGAIRIVVLVSDEAPCQGCPCADPGKDRDTIDNAVSLANANDVIVFPITGTLATGEGGCTEGEHLNCLIPLADELALLTGGQAFHREGPNALTYEQIGPAIVSAIAPYTLGCFDLNDNGIPDECELLADVNGDGCVDVLDLLAVIAAWGQSGGPADVNFDGTVDVLDLLAVIHAWGEGCANYPGDPPQSILDCISKYGDDPEKLEGCIEAMIKMNTP